MVVDGRDDVAMSWSSSTTRRRSRTEVQDHVAQETRTEVVDHDAQAAPY